MPELMPASFSAFFADVRLGDGWEMSWGIDSKEDGNCVSVLRKRTLCWGIGSYVVADIFRCMCLDVGRRPFTSLR